jgi:cytochrome c oxidase subunit II
MNDSTRVILSVACSLLVGCNGVPRGSMTHTSPEFAQFFKAHRDRASPNPEDLVRQGEQVFLQGPCVMCHTVRGTRALARVGPDLTHFASRSTIAAGTLPNNRGHLAGWILNPQNLKPGTQMPPSLLPGEDIHALIAYLESLK